MTKRQNACHQCVIFPCRQQRRGDQRLSTQYRRGLPHRVLPRAMGGLSPWETVGAFSVLISAKVCLTWPRSGLDVRHVGSWGRCSRGHESREPERFGGPSFRHILGHRAGEWDAVSRGARRRSRGAA
jgi:hypothetical protein